MVHRCCCSHGRDTISKVFTQNKEYTHSFISCNRKKRKGKTKLINMSSNEKEIVHRRVLVRISPVKEDVTNTAVHTTLTFVVGLDLHGILKRFKRTNRSETKMRRIKALAVERRDARQTPAKVAAFVETAGLTIQP